MDNGRIMKELKELQEGVKNVSQSLIDGDFLIGFHLRNPLNYLKVIVNFLLMYRPRENKS